MSQRMSNQFSERLLDDVKQLPSLPGVYRFFDEAGHILYVGKAVSLSNRVRSYFGNDSGLNLKTQRLVSHIHELEFIVTTSEQADTRAL